MRKEQVIIGAVGTLFLEACSHRIAELVREFAETHTIVDPRAGLLYSAAVALSLLIAPFVTHRWLHKFDASSVSLGAVVGIVVGAFYQVFVD